MTTPNLLHPVPITIQRLSRSTTRVDPDAREPIQAAARLPDVVVPGQPKWSGTNLVTSGGGSSETDSGYVLFRYVDLDLLLGPDGLRIGDRMVAQGRIVREVYVTRLEPIGHYPPNGATLVRAWFADRNPAKVRR